MGQRLNTGESYNFYLCIFICCGPLTALVAKYGHSGKYFKQFHSEDEAKLIVK